MKMVLSLAQFSVIEGDTLSNLQKGRLLIEEAVARESNLIVFPELWTTGFNWPANEREVHQSEKVIHYLSEWAYQYNIWVAGSILTFNERRQKVNRALLIDNHGTIVATYDKIHLFSGIQEPLHLTAGTHPTVVQTPWGLLGFAICYDLRFPELFRCYALQGVELILLLAAFPFPKEHHWDILIRARAIENQCYIVAVNQVDITEPKLSPFPLYFGKSAIIDPWGDTVIQSQDKKEVLVTAPIDLKTVDQARQRMQVLKDRQPDAYCLK